MSKKSTPAPDANALPETGPLALRKGQRSQTLTARSAAGGTVTTEFRAGAPIPEGYRPAIQEPDLERFEPYVDGIHPAAIDGDPTTQPAA